MAIEEGWTEAAKIGLSMIYPYLPDALAMFLRHRETQGDDMVIVFQDHGDDDLMIAIVPRLKVLAALPESNLPAEHMGTFVQALSQPAPDGEFWFLVAVEGVAGVAKYEWRNAVDRQRKEMN